MRKQIRIVTCTLLTLLLLLTGCGQADSGTSTAADTDALTSTAETSESEERETDASEDRMNEITYTTQDGETGYLYIPQSVLERPEQKVPMVLMMMCTGGAARQNAEACGWVDKALEEGIIVLAPVYNNYATYSELAGIISAVEYASENYPVDTSRIYATGFSNGGAVAVAMASEYPQTFAAISSYGWMVDMRNRDADYDMPFQVIQGTEEYTYMTGSGAMAIMEDEQRAIRSLFLFNEMIDEDMQPDYDAAPYWGYSPEDSYTINPDGREWQVNNFYKAGYTAPFAQFVLIEGAGHQPNSSEADVSWEFFRHFSRSGDGSIVEQNENTTEQAGTEITLDFDGTVVTGVLDDSETTQAFLEHLPLTLTMNRYGDREYYAAVAKLPENGEAIPDYKNGDITYYTTGQSLAIFFGNAEQSSQDGLIRMGRITSDLKAFDEIGDTVEVTINYAE